MSWEIFKMQIKKEYSKPILRWALGLVFLYFGFQQVKSPDSWTNFVPQFLTGSFLSANNIVMTNAILELTLGLFLILGIYTRFSSIILSLHLFGIAFSVGFNPIGVRDFGLAFATLSIFLNGPDEYCLDLKIKKKGETLEVKEEPSKEKPADEQSAKEQPKEEIKQSEKEEEETKKHSQTQEPQKN